MRNGTRTTNLVTCNISLKLTPFYSSLIYSHWYNKEKMKVLNVKQGKDNKELFLLIII